MTSKFSRTHQEIIDTAMDLLRAIHPDDLTVETICRNAEVSRSTFYNHFKSLEDLITEHFSQAQRLTSPTMGWILSANTAYEQAIRVHLAYIQESYLPNSTDLYRINMKSHLTNPSADRLHMSDHMRDILTPLISLAQKNNEIGNTMPAQDLCEVAIKIHWGNMYLWAISNGGFDRSAMMRRDLEALYCVREDLKVSIEE